MWQETVIVIIAVIVAASAGYRIWRYFTKPASPCDGCAGCSLKEQMQNKTRKRTGGAECPQNRKNT
jgi:hypothetical protein